MSCSVLVRESSGAGLGGAATAVDRVAGVSVRASRPRSSAVALLDLRSTS